MQAHDVTRAIGRALRPFHAGDKKLAWHRLIGYRAATLDVSSSTFPKGGTLPPSATRAAARPIPPSMEVAGLPPAARSVALICEDPDAPMMRPFVHWIVYGLPARDGMLDISRAREGKNSTLKLGFAPAAPPTGHGLHHYHFEVFALDTELPLEPGRGRSELLDALRGHVIAWGELVGTYEEA